MRRFVIVLAIATTLAASGIGRAEGELAKCKNSAPGQRGCSMTFVITEPMAVNLRLAPEVGYTGSLLARIVTYDAASLTKATVGAYYAAGQALPVQVNMSAETMQILQPGKYNLVVESAKLLRICAGQCTDRVPIADTYAVGAFAAEVVPTDAVV